MPHVSRKKVKKEILNKILDFLVLALTEIKEEKEMRLFLDSFFTSTEKVMLTKRLGVVYLLQQNVSKEKIATILSIGRPTIERMELWLNAEGEGYEIAMSILKKSARIDEFKQVFADILKKMAHPYRGILSLQRLV